MTDAAPAEEAPPPPPPPPPTLAEWWAGAGPLATKTREEIEAGGETSTATYLQSFYSLATIAAPVDEQAAAMFAALGRSARLFVASCRDAEQPTDVLRTRSLDLLAKWARDPETGAQPDAAALAGAVIPGPPTEELKGAWAEVIAAVQAYLVDAEDAAATEESLAEYDAKIAAAADALRAQVLELAESFKQGAKALGTSLSVNKPKPEPPAEAAPPPAEAAPAEGGGAADAAAAAPA